MLPSYINDRHKDAGPIKIDRTLRNGETFTWEGYTLTCDWMPGQTKFHACLHGDIDGKRIAFTGDNIFASATDPTQGGNEAVVARNGGILEEGYLYAAAYLHGIAPDLILGGHCWAMDKPHDLIERYRTRMLALRDAFQSLSVEDDYRYMFDPYWVRAAPYRVMLKRGAATEFDVVVRNFRTRNQTHRIAKNPRRYHGHSKHPRRKIGSGRNGFIQGETHRRQGCRGRSANGRFRYHSRRRSFRRAIRFHRPRRRSSRATLPGNGAVGKTKVLTTSQQCPVIWPIIIP